MTVVLATICARGGSKGVPGKNVRELLGRPQLAYTVDCARACAEIDAIVVSTDSDEIAAIAESCGLEVPFRRPVELAADDSPKIEAIRHATLWVERTAGLAPDLVVDLDIGTPLRRPEDVAGCLRVLEEHPELDAAVTVYEAERNPYFNMVEPVGEVEVKLVKEAPEGVTRRQDAPRVWSITPAAFAFRRSRLMEIVHLFTGRWGAWEIPRERGIDIDTELDFRLVELLMRRQEPAG